MNASPAPLSVDLNTNMVSCGDEVIKLPAQSAELLYALVRCAPALVDHGGLLVALWGSMDSPDCSAKQIQTLISKLRQQLQPWGWAIENSWNRGYRLCPINPDAPAQVRVWEEWEIEALRDGVNSGTPVREIAEMKLPHRRLAAVLQKAHRLGLTELEPRWTQDQLREIERLRLREGRTYDECASALKVSKNSIAAAIRDHLPHLLKRKAEAA